VYVYVLKALYGWLDGWMDGCDACMYIYNGGIVWMDATRVCIYMDGWVDRWMRCVYEHIQRNVYVYVCMYVSYVMYVDMLMNMNGKHRT
jgi:hypothetical protein